MAVGGTGGAGEQLAGQRAGEHPVLAGAEDDVARELVADDERRAAAAARPVVPLVDVDVGAADAGAPHADQHLVVADRRLPDTSDIKHTAPTTASCPSTSARGPTTLPS